MVSKVSKVTKRDSSVDRIFTIENYGCSPNTEKSFKTCLKVSPDGKYLAYGCENVVILREVSSRYRENTIFTCHKSKVTALDFAPSGTFVASADESGTIKIWYLDDCYEKLTHANVLSSKILGLHWNDKSDKIWVYGHGGKKGFARYVSWDTVNNIGDYTKFITKNVCSGDIKLKKPYALLAGSEDLNIRVFEGPPYSLKHEKKLHKSFISDLQYSPDFSKFASVGLDRKLLIFNSSDGELIQEFDREFEGAHSGGIVAVCWLNEDFLATGSLDKSVKVWDLKNRKQVTLRPNENDEEDQEQCGLTKTKEHLISLNYDGRFNYWSLKDFNSDLTFFKENQLPQFTLDGHQTFIKSLQYNKKHDLLISSDAKGKISKFA